MSAIMETVDVAVDVPTAYNQWTQFEEFPRFMEGVAEVRQTTDEMTHWKVKIAGATREFDARITEQHPDERIAWESVAGPRHAGVVTFHRLDGEHTRVTLQTETDPTGLAEKVADVSGLLKRQAESDMERFKTFVEHRGTATGGWRGEVEPPHAR
ncbi:MAG: SRPBCC family protein [Actinocatenispora sp.]